MPDVDAATATYVYDTSTDAPLAHDDILLEFSGATLTRRWLHSDSVDEPVGFEDVGGSTYDLYADRMGSISKVVDTTTGAIAAEYSYDSYGAQITHAASLFQHYGYTARETDPESGLMHYRARAYDPNAGVFLQVDPIEFGSGNLNVTAYIENNVYNYKDPSGLLSFNEYKKMTITGAAEALKQTGTAAGAAFKLALEASAYVDMFTQYLKYKNELNRQPSSHGNAGSNTRGQDIYMGKCSPGDEIIRRIGVSNNFKARSEQHARSFGKNFKIKSVLKIIPQPAARRLALSLEHSISNTLRQINSKNVQVCKYHKRP